MVSSKLGTALKTKRYSCHSAHSDGTKTGNTAKSGGWMSTKSKTKWVNYTAIHQELQKSESLSSVT